MRTTYALLLFFLAACGIDAKGTGPADGGTPSPLPPAPPPPSNPGTPDFCKTLASDTTVKGCWDFDFLPQTDFNAKFGFTNIERGLGAGFQIEPSVDQLGHNNALRVTLAEASGSRTARVSQQLAFSPNPIGKVHLHLDAHIVVHDDSVSGHLLTIDVLGATSAKYVGIGVENEQLFSTETQVQTRATIVKEKPFKLTLDLEIQAGAAGNRKVTIDDAVVLDSTQVFWDVDANNVLLSMGTYFTAQASGGISASFDEVVLRQL